MFMLIHLIHFQKGNKKKGNKNSKPTIYQETRKE